MAPLRTNIGAPPIDVMIRRSARARRMTLRVSQISREATLTVPVRLRQSQINAFLDRQETWLRAQIEKTPQRIRPEFGTNIPVEGNMLEIVEGSSGPVRSGDGFLAVTGSPGSVGPKLRGYLKILARERLSLAAGRYAEQLERRVSRLTLRDTRSRWGSCTSAGNLMFSWRLVMAPIPVLEYVAAHEAAHLVHMDHSKAFWGLVQDLYGDFRSPRQWLRREGASLHRYDFDLVT